MGKQKVSIISAIGVDGGIGKDNNLLWKIPRDLQRFKKLTLGKVVIMGRKTHKSIGRILPKRMNFVITRQENVKIEGVKVFGSLNQAIENAKSINNNEIFIIGGASVYKQSIDFVDKLYLTKIDAKKESDVFFPKYDNFHKTFESGINDYQGLKYKFIELERTDK